MVSKTISLKEETYRRLAGVKAEGESFSEVIDRLLDVEDQPLYELVGLLDDAEVNELRKQSKRFREALDGRVGVTGDG